MTGHPSIMPSWLIFVMVVASAASAQDSAQVSAQEARPGPAPGDIAPPRLEVSVRSGAWIPRLDGEVALGADSGNPNIQLTEQFDLGDSEFVVNAELTLRFDDRWYVRLTGLDFSTDTASNFAGTATFGAVTLNDGDAFTAAVDMTSVSLEAGLDLSRPVPDRRRHEPAGVSVRLAGVAGLRFLRVDQDVVRLAGGSEAATGNWLALYAGADIELRWAADPARPRGRGLALDVGFAVGFDAVQGGFLAQVHAGLTLEVTDNFGFEVGYRLLEVDFEDAPYGFDAGLQGLFIGGVLRF